MKKLSLSCLLLPAALTTFAQTATDPDTSLQLKSPIRKGAFTLGSNILLADMTFGGGSSTGTHTTYNIGLSPRLSYFVNDHLAVGVTLQGQVSGMTNYTSRSLGAGAFGRYYFGNGMKDGQVKKMRFFVEGGVNFNHGTTTLKHPDGTKTTQDFSSVSPYVMPGFNYFLNKNVAIEGGVYYMHSRYSGSTANRNQLGLNLGLQFFFNRR